jgi:hypothetical protein
VIGVEQWAEIRRLYLVEKRSKRAIHRLTGVHRDTITLALISDLPPKYVRAVAGSKLDPFTDWVCERLRDDTSIQSLRLREQAVELGYWGTAYRRAPRRGISASAGPSRQGPARPTARPRATCR